MIFTALLLALLGGGEYPIGHEFGGFLTGGGGRKVEVKHRVDKKEDKYLYTYKIKNASKSVTVYVQWELLSPARGIMWVLPPGEEMEFNLESKESPVWASGSLITYSKMSLSGLAPLIEEETGLKLPRHIRTLGLAAGGQPGPVPKSWKKKED